MEQVTVTNKTIPTSQPLLVNHCTSFLSRLKGLMFEQQIDPRGGILMVQETQSRMSASIHMFFMNFDITVVWLDNQLRVVDVIIAHKWQPMLAPVAPARYILETHPDRFSDFNIGDQIEISPI